MAAASRKVLRLPLADSLPLRMTEFARLASIPLPASTPPRRADSKHVPPETNSDTITPDALVTQVIEQNTELAKSYAGGDLGALSVLQDKAVKLAAGRVNEQTLQDTLMRKLGASI